MQARQEGADMSKKVLIVDDEPSTVALVERALQRDGIETCTAVNGAACLQVVAADCPDLVILDVNMPVMDGFQALRLLRESAATRNLPVIMLTTRNADADVVRGWTTGIDFYLTKPFDVAELLLIVRRELEGMETRGVEDEPTDGSVL